MLLRRVARKALALLRTLRLGRREGRFATVYAEGYWGRVPDQRYFSGIGSLPQNCGPFCDFVSQFIRTNSIRSVVDLGCGDFRVGSSIDLNGADYLGVDIVSSLIRYNVRHFGSQNVRFVRLDAMRDPLPPADLCLLRQVLQHWSDDDILALLPKLSIYKHVLILDGLMVAEATPGRNTNIRTGVVNRRSGLYLEAPPFNCSVEQLMSYGSEDGAEEFRLLRYLSR